METTYPLFRPNFVVDGADLAPWVEDSWTGQVRYMTVHLLSRKKDDSSKIKYFSYDLEQLSIEYQQIHIYFETV